ncbi:T9SS type A sorting domain-containing protein [Ekhidna sp.]|uniref:T9SS type A sorting domain-containing protein n=1 Tax=Ekhidna sp. TaxID=2608089 RepID=UPI003B50C845
MILIYVSSNALLSQTTFTYSGASPVTVDGGTGTLTINVPTSSFGFGAVVTDINVTLHYDKTDGTCAAPGTGGSFHDEHGFELESPDGGIVTIFSTGTFAGATDISPGVTQTFDDESSTAIPGGVPADGTYIPESALSGFDGIDPEGTWTIRATETGVNDPLCIIGASIQITVEIPTASPGDASNVVLWLKPDKGVSVSGTNVLAWQDAAGNGLTASQAVPADQPSYTSNAINGYPSLTFDGTNSFLDLGDIFNYTPQTDEFSFLAVLNPTANGDVIFGRSTTGLSGNYAFYVGGDEYRHIIGGTNNTAGTANILNSFTQVSSVVNTVDFDSYVNGTSDVAAGTIGTGTVSTNLLIGARNGGSANNFGGQISEIIFFDAALSNSARRDVETYLAIKYGLTLDITSLAYTVGGSPIYSVGSSYSNDIAGIGQDDSQGLLQTSSISTSGDIVSMDGASDLADGEFLIWGHDGGATTTTTANIPSGVTNRLTRIWSVEETGDVGTIDISFNLTTLGLALTGQDFALITAASGATMPTDLATGSVALNGAISQDATGDDIVTFEDVAIADGDFFTLATQPEVGPGDLAANLVLWLDPDKGVTTSGTNVTDWADQSDSGINAAQATSNDQPTYKTSAINSHAVLEFDGTDDYLDLGDVLDFVPGTDAFSFFAIFNTLDNGTILSRANDGTAANRQYQFITTGGDYSQIIGGTQSTGTTPVVDDAWTIVGTMINTANLDTYLNGAIEINNGGVGIASETTNVLIGARTGGAGYIYGGDIAEILMFDAELTVSQRRDVETYLALKYALTLDISTENYTVGGTSIYNHTTYSNDIAGIIIDNSQGLSETSVQSTSGGVVTVSNASGLADGESFIWGHDGGSVAVTTSDVPGGTTNRLTRIWRLDETGDVGTVDLSFDLTALGIDGSTSTLELLIAASGATMPTGLSTATVNSSGTVSTVNGSEVVTFSGVDFADGEYFTLAGNLNKPAPGGVSTGLSLWLRADKGVATSGSNITEWIDQSGNVNNASQSETASQPDLVSESLNHNPGVNFDGSNTMTASGGFNSAESFIVIDPNEIYNNVNAVGRIIGFEQGDFTSIALGPTTVLQDDEIITYALDGGGYRAMQVSTTSNFGDPSIINPRHNAGVTGEDIYRNGTQIVDTELNAGSFNTRADQAFQLGESYNAAVSAPFNGAMTEVISYSSTLTQAQRRDVATYLAIKYGITLDISTLAYTVGGSSIYNYTTYANDIAGIGKNEITQALNQTVSMSVNEGAIVEVYSAADLDNGEYLVWGHDGGANTFTTSNVPSGATERLTKIWRIAETGDVGTVTIAFDITTLGIDIDNSTINLIKAVNTATMPTDLTTSTLITGGTVSNVNGRDIVTFTNVDFSNGEYFTIGGDVQTSAPGGVSSGLTLWLRADDGVTSSGGLVSNWSDKSGNTNNAFQGNTASQPALVSTDLNTHDVINFSNDNLGGIAGFNSQDYFVVAVPDVAADNLTNHGYIVSYTNVDGNGLALGTVTANLADEVVTHIVTDGAANEYASGQLSTTVTYGTPTLFNPRNNVGATGQELYIDGSNTAVTEANTVNFANNTDASYTIGQNSVQTNDFDGSIAEIISFSSRLSDADRRDVASYLALRYGLTLDISTTGYTESGVTIYNETTYSNDIAGIGQNLDNALQQTTSGSTNTGAIVSMTNASDLDNGEYIIWGNEGTDKTTVQATELPATFDERLSTEWVSVVTGSPGTVDIRIYVADISNYATRGQTAGLYNLLLNSTANFSTITSSVAASSISGDTLTFQNVSLSGTTYFTLAVPPVVNPGGTGNTLWLRADAGVTVSGSEVTAWADQSGNGNDAAPVTTGPTRITSQFNTNPAFDFTSESLTGAAGFNTQDYFIVLDPDNSLTSASNDEMPLGFDTGSSAGLAFGAHDGTLTNEVITHSTSGGYASGQEDVAATYSDLIVINARNNAGGTDQDIYLNGATLTVNTTGTFANFSGNYSIGDNINRDDAFNGKIAEILSFSSRQTNADRRDIETYLAIKYGITLDISTENYTVGGSAVYSQTTYANDIAGIGSDNGLGLAQTSSTSNNTDAIITMSAATAQSDGDFVVWGNDNGSTATTTAGVPTGTGITERMTRIWGVTETGDPGTVTVAFDLTGLGFGASSIDDFSLIVDTNNDFTDGILGTYSAASYASDVVTFTGVDFTTATNFGLGTALNTTLDTDTDGIPDYFETAYGTDGANGDSPVAGGSPNTDASTTNGVLGDGISDALESILVTNGATAPVTIFTDTDGDGIPDHIEVDNGTNPFAAGSPTTNGNSDSDSDGIPDALEALITSEGGAADPALDTDTDADGIPDYYEVMNGSDPNDVNSPTASGGSDGDADGISDALEAQLISGSATAPIGVDTDTDGDGIPDYIEAQTFSDPFNAASPAPASTPGVRSLLADYVVTGGSCISISGYQWIDVTDNLGNIVFSINPAGNNLGSTCWGVRIVDPNDNDVRDNTVDYVLDRNWYITPTTQPSNSNGVYIRFYALAEEHTDLGDELLAAESFTFDEEAHLRITKITGISNSLDPFIAGGTRVNLDPEVQDYSTNGKSLTIGITSFSSFAPHTTPSGIEDPLPVELMSFQASIQDQYIVLDWATASELNNDYFTIEKSSDGENFEALKEIDGAGNSNERLDYRFEDRQPLLGVNYYRLRQTDFDGTETYSEVVMVVFEGQSQLVINVYPNPTRNKLFVSFASDFNVGSPEIHLVDLKGQKVASWKIAADNNTIEVDLAEYPKGIYLLQMEVGNRTYSHKVIKK